MPFLFMLDPPGKQRKPKSSRPLPSEVRRAFKVLQRSNRRKAGLSFAKATRADLPEKRMDEEKYRETAVESRWRLVIFYRLLLDAYILNIYRQALANYVPRPYSGPVTLFKTEGESYRPRFDWTSLTTGELQIHEGFGEHMDLRKEPFIRVWAEYMTQSLDRAQQTLEIGDRKVDAGHRAVKV